ncbi:hypothetical protein ACWKWU_07725 [Chitinophaga lutea]
MKFRTFLPVIAALLMATAVSAQEKPKKSAGESNPKGQMVKFTPPKVTKEVEVVEVKEVKKEKSANRRANANPAAKPAQKPVEKRSGN